MQHKNQGGYHNEKNQTRYNTVWYMEKNLHAFILF